MNSVIELQGVTKCYGKQIVLDDVSLTIEQGSIVGLIGHNGAGKTCLLRAILGILPCDGKIQVMGMNPHKVRHKLLEQVAYIPDTAIMPDWLTAEKVMLFMENTHPAFQKEKFQYFISRTNIELKTRIGKLSKGMKVQLHLALVMALDVPLLILDEPTLGLDVEYRRHFYQSLLNDFYDRQRTILVTSHEINEMENILSHVIMLKHGQIILDSELEAISHQFVEIEVTHEHLEAARKLNPLSERSVLGGARLIFENSETMQSSLLGKSMTPSLTDIFIAKNQMKGAPL